MRLSIESTLVGVAGEYLVAGELTMRGYLASITLRNSRGVDILASNSDASRAISVQVKSNKSGKPVWLLSKKSETFYADNHFYVFVALNQLGSRPNYHIVPSMEVAKQISKGHAEWLQGIKKDGTPRNDSNMRQFIDEAGIYKERWDLLGLSDD